MNKAKRRKLRQYSNVLPSVLVKNTDLNELLDYVDALEAACERIARLNEIYVTPAGAGNHAIKVAREALAKEK